MIPRLRALPLALSCLLLPSILLGAERRPDILLLTVDTLRADALGCYGSDNETPHLDQLAKRGIQFEDAITTIGKTGPAMASMFSSLFPPTHGARRNGVPMRADVPVLAETLRQAGYQTAAFISNWTLRSRLAAVDRGFEHWDEDFDRKRHVFGAAERPAESVIEATFEWWSTGRDPNKPLFLWVHFSEPHTPYVLHDGFEPAKPTDDDAPRRLKRWRYASEVLYTDHRIGELLAELDQRMSREPLIAFLADHGESLGEHGYWGHGKNAHWPNLDIPFLLSGPGVPVGKRSKLPASSVDLYPTILALLGIDPPPGLEGRNLLALSEQEGQDRPRYAFGDRYTAVSKKAKTGFANPLEIALVANGIKTLYDFSQKNVRYFDLRTDPLENRPLTESPVRVRPPLGRQLATWYRGLPKYDGEEGELSEEDVRQLKSLGYLGGR